MNIGLIFPHQLYQKLPFNPVPDLLILIEDSLYFGDREWPLRFHKKKLVLHRASMRWYKDTLMSNYLSDQSVGMIEYDPQTTTEDLLRMPLSDLLRRAGIREGFYTIPGNQHITFYVIDPTDDILERRVRKGIAASGYDLIWYTSPNFITQPDLLRDFFGIHSAPGSSASEKDGSTASINTSNKQPQSIPGMAAFYQWQRKRMKVLVTGGDKTNPVGGKWSFDTENRKKIPKDLEIPDHMLTPGVHSTVPTEVVDEDSVLHRGILSRPDEDDYYVNQAIIRVNQDFPDNPGTTDGFVYPISHKHATNWLTHFLDTNLTLFGPYEDAIDTRHATWFHSVLTPSLNCGLLNPLAAVKGALSRYDSGSAPLPSVEGFVRQIIGWREYMRAVYILYGRYQRLSNHFSHYRKLNSSWYDGTTGIAPLDDLIQKIQYHAYAHHIERLMIAGNIMLISEISPDEAYRWFMEMFIDSYDWVMVPNVYGMSQYADGGLITTKPYFSASNYILKMSNYSRGDWSDMVDGLFWRFVFKHRTFLESNYRLRMMTKQLDRKDRYQLETLMRKAEDALTQLTDD